MFSNRQLLVYLLITWALLLMRTNPFEGDQHRQTALKVKQLFPELSARIPDLARIEISDIDSKVVLELPSEDSPYSSLHWLVRDKRHPADRYHPQRGHRRVRRARGMGVRARTAAPSGPPQRRCGCLWGC